MIVAKNKLRFRNLKEVQRFVLKKNAAAGYYSIETFKVVSRVSVE